MKKALALIAVAAASGLAFAGSRSVVIVSDGVQRACLVVPSDAPKCVQVAAKELAMWTKALTGAELPVGPARVHGMLPISFLLDGKAPGQVPIDIDDISVMATVAGGQQRTAIK